jgi:hypothetical protein
VLLSVLILLFFFTAAVSNRPCWLEFLLWLPSLLLGHAGVSNVEEN